MEAVGKIKNEKIDSDNKIIKKREREKEMVSFMIAIYCKGAHKNRQAMKGELCPDCEELKNYARQRSEKCPFMETKTFCAGCKVHCYKPEMREKIRAVMRYAGPRMMFHCPIQVVRHVIARRKGK